MNSEEYLFCPKGFLYALAKTVCIQISNSEKQLPAIRTKLFDLLEINALGFEICMLNILFFSSSSSSKIRPIVQLKQVISDLLLALP